MNYDSLKFLDGLLYEWCMCIYQKAKANNAFASVQNFEASFGRLKMNFHDLNQDQSNYWMGCHVATGGHVACPRPKP
jgi:hypothetical protein